MHTQNTYEYSFHMDEIPTMSQEPQLQQVSGGIMNGIEGNPIDLDQSEWLR